MTESSCVLCLVDSFYDYSAQLPDSNIQALCALPRIVMAQFEVVVETIVAILELIYCTVALDVRFAVVTHQFALASVP